MLRCMNSLYILDINPFPAMLFANIVTYLVVRLFFLLIANSPVQNFLVWCICLFLLLIPLPRETYQFFYFIKVHAKEHTAYVFSPKFFVFFFWLCPAMCKILVPQPGIKLVPSVVEATGLNHWTSREVLFWKFYDFQFLWVVSQFEFICVYGK